MTKGLPLLVGAVLMILYWIGVGLTNVHEVVTCKGGEYGYVPAIGIALITITPSVCCYIAGLHIGKESSK